MTIMPRSGARTYFIVGMILGGIDLCVCSCLCFACCGGGRCCSESDSGSRIDFNDNPTGSGRGGMQSTEWNSFAENQEVHRVVEEARVRRRGGPPTPTRRGPADFVYDLSNLTERAWDSFFSQAVAVAESLQARGLLDQDDVSAVEPYLVLGAIGGVV